jgi:hypothetical protein
MSNYHQGGCYPNCGCSSRPEAVISSSIDNLAQMLRYHKIHSSPTGQLRYKEDFMYGCNNCCSMYHSICYCKAKYAAQAKMKWDVENMKLEGDE